MKDRFTGTTPDDEVPPVPVFGGLGSGIVFPWTLGGSIQAQWTTADSPCDLEGESGVVGIDLAYITIDLLLSDSYWGIEFGPSGNLAWPPMNVHVYPGQTWQLTEDILAPVK